MADVNVFTVMFELVPPIIVSFAYLILFRKRRNRFIEAFIALMFVKSVTFFLYRVFISYPYQGSGFDPNVNLDTLYWLSLAEFLFQFAYGLQEFLTWVMISFIAVLFGMLVLALKIALQDPLKMKFSNVIKRIVGKEPESDGYKGFRDRLNHLKFEGVPENPLDPAVQRKAWSSAWRDYLIIGLATLLPSISAYVGTLPYYIGIHTDPNMIPIDPYISGVLVFLTWIYRFGYPASNRIAKGAGLKLGDRDIGDEMMRGVLGWFFRLNILLTLFFLINDAIIAVSEGVVDLLISYYIEGLWQAFPPILFAIIVLPLAERFSVVLYKTTFETITQAGSKIREMNVGRGLINLIAAVSIGGLMSLAFVGAILGVTLHTSYSMFLGLKPFPGQIVNYIIYALTLPPNNAFTITPGFWVLLILTIPMAIMLLTGIVGHYVRNRLDAGMESFAFIAGLFTAVATYFLLPGLDYQIGTGPITVVIGDITFYRDLPVLVLPGTTPEEYLYRLAYQFIVNVPIFISAALFVIYYFEYRERWQEETQGDRGPLLKVTSEDIVDVVKLFFVGIALSAFCVFGLSFYIDPGALAFLINNIVIEIGMPNGLEMILEMEVSVFVILTEHNIVRTLLMLVIGPIFWSIILWMASTQPNSNERNTGVFVILSFISGSAVAVIWSVVDFATGNLMFGWPFAAELGIRAVIINGILFGIFGLIALFNYATKKSFGGWWLPPMLALLFIEYFVYDDQFTYIALIVLPIILTILYRGFFPDREDVKSEDFLITYIRLSIISVAIAEVLSTALWLAGIGALSLLFANINDFLASVLPHAIIEIPTFLFAAALSFRIAKDLWPAIRAEQWSEIPKQTRELLTDGRLWRSYLLIMFFLLIAALVEAYITPLVRMLV